jgi:hypothetical protein
MKIFIVALNGLVGVDRLFGLQELKLFFDVLIWM